MTSPYRMLVTGSPEWDEEQELRLELIHAAVPHLRGGVVVVCDPSVQGAEAMAADWVHDYGLRTELAGAGRPGIVLVFGDAPAGAAYDGVTVRRYRQARAA